MWIGILDNDIFSLKTVCTLLRQNLDCSILWYETLARRALLRCLEDDLWPDVIMVDMSLSDMSGIDFCREIRSNNEVTPILAYTSFPLDVYASDAAKNGAQGIVSKNNLNSIVQALLRVSSGGIVNVESIEFHTVVDSYQILKTQKKHNYMTLTLREVEILDLLLEGLSQKEISNRLGISAASVRTHSRIVRQKLGVSSLAQAISIWVGLRDLYRIKNE